MCVFVCLLLLLFLAEFQLSGYLFGLFLTDTMECFSENLPTHFPSMNEQKVSRG